MLKTSHNLRAHNKKTLMVVILIVEILLMALIVVSLVREYMRTQSVREARIALESDVSKLIKEREDLSSLMQQFASPQFQEKIARTKLGFANPQEKVYVINGDLPAAGADQSGAGVSLSPVQLWWQYFFSAR